MSTKVMQETIAEYFKTQPVVKVWKRHKEANYNDKMRTKHNFFAFARIFLQ